MRIPQILGQWCEDGLIEEVHGALKAGKEAEVWLVMYRGKLCAAKVYKDREGRSFKNRSPYMEGRKVRSSRLQRAMSKGSRFGHDSEEAAWKSAEVDALRVFHAAGIRVPEPLLFCDGVLVMNLVVDANGDPAPRLAELEFSPQEAFEVHRVLLGFIGDMLALGYVHGDFSLFNVLMAAGGPTVIDFPQVVSAAHNRQARHLVLRDIQKTSEALAKFNPDLINSEDWGEALWRLYENSELKQGMKIIPAPRPKVRAKVDIESLNQELRAVEREREEETTKGGPQTGRSGTGRISGIF